MGSRLYIVTTHARDRLAERYGMRLEPEDWDHLAREIEGWPYLVMEQRRSGCEVREAQVTLRGPDGRHVVIPVRYDVTSRQVRILTVMPGGFQLRRHHASPSHP